MQEIIKTNKKTQKTKGKVSQIINRLFQIALTTAFRSTIGKKLFN